MNHFATYYYKNRTELCYSIRKSCEKSYKKVSRMTNPITNNGLYGTRNDDINFNLSRLTQQFSGLSFKTFKRGLFEAFILIDDIYKAIMVIKSEASIDMYRRNYEKKPNNYVLMLLRELNNPEHQYVQLFWDGDYRETFQQQTILPKNYKDYSLLFLLHCGKSELNDMQIIYTDERLEVLDRCGINISPTTEKPLVKLKGNNNVSKNRKQA